MVYQSQTEKNRALNLIPNIQRCRYCPILTQAINETATVLVDSPQSRFFVRLSVSRAYRYRRPSCFLMYQRGGNRSLQLQGRQVRKTVCRHLSRFDTHPLIDLNNLVEKQGTVNSLQFLENILYSIFQTKFTNKHSLT